MVAATNARLLLGLRLERRQPGTLRLGRQQRLLLLPRLLLAQARKQLFFNEAQRDNLRKKYSPRQKKNKK